MSMNLVDKTTGELTPVAGNATDKVGNLSSLTTTDKSSCVGAINEVNGLAITYGPYTISNATDDKDFIKKVIQQAHSDLATKNAYTLYNIFATYSGLDNFYGIIERQNTAGYAFMLSRASGNAMYQGYCDISSDYISVYKFDGVAI